MIRWPARELIERRDGETKAEARHRRDHNRAARAAWELASSERCARCGYARINVRHERDPEHSSEGPDYYADMLDELHDFEPSGRTVR